MAGSPRIISPLLIAVAIHMVSSFVQLSPSRTSTNPRIQSAVFSTATNSTLSVPTTIVAPLDNGGKKIIKRKYTVGKYENHAANGTQKNKRKRPESQAISKEKSAAKNQNRRRKWKQKRGPAEDQFQWLHWVWNQWKDTSPGDLTDENVIKQMFAAIPRWSKRKSEQAAGNAEELLERLIQEAIAGNPHMRTNATSGDALPTAMLSVTHFNAAMDAYGKIGNPAGVQRILRRMESLRTSGVQDFADLQPDEFSMSTLATAWAKSHSEEAAQKAEAIIQYMDLNGLIANTITYNSVLHAIAVGNQCDRALRAEDMVQRMKLRHNEKGEDCKPDVYTYQSLIQAWSRTQMPGSPQEAERILGFMDDEASTGEKNCHLMAPNTYCFTSKFREDCTCLCIALLVSQHFFRPIAVIHSWARSSERKRARQAYQLLNIMTRRYNDARNEYKSNPTKKNKHRYKLLKPNVKTFTAVLNACARPIEDSEKGDAFAIAKLAMAELSVGTYGKPNFLSYAAYLAVCATTLEAGPERDAETKKVFQDCINAGQVAQIVLEKLYTAVSPEMLFELIGDHLNENGKITIPSHWNRSTKGERVGGNFLAQNEFNDEVVRSIPKSFQQRIEDVQKYGGKSGVYSGLSSPTMLKKGEDEIMWSKDEFSWGDDKK